MPPRRIDRLVLTLLLSVSCLGSVAAATPVLDMRERAQIVDGWLAERIDSVLPLAMQRAGIDMWLIIAREYNEDPVIETMLPATWLSARRRTILVVWQPEDAPLETLAVARYDVGSRFRRSWDPAVQPDQWAALARIVKDRDPRRIGIDVSADFALADGLSHNEYETLVRALPPVYRERLVPAEAAAIAWLETRTPAEMAVYGEICRIAHEILAQGLSSQVIRPGVTTTDDVAWWYRETIRRRALSTWFHPSVSIQRAGDASGASAPGGEAGVILPGDLLHVDFGITYLRLNTDTQQHAYVLRPGETSPPAGLVAALARANRMQDLLTAQFSTGSTGNEILARTLALAREEGITGSIYTHPIGQHGHGAGTTIGLWDHQDGLPGRGDYPLYPNTVHAIELNARSDLPEWGTSVQIQLEEDAFFDGSSVRYLDGRQTELLLIPGTSGCPSANCSDAPVTAGMLDSAP
jgi:Xaa-Pro aminopeptidase